MSLPGDRDAQRMLMGEQPLSKGRPLRPQLQTGGRTRGLQQRADRMPGTSALKHLERKADPGIGVCHPSVHLTIKLCTPKTSWRVNTSCLSKG